MKTVIDKWRLNKVVLAQKMNMPHSTFKNKYRETGGKYKFTEAEKKQLDDILLELATDISLLLFV